MVNALYSTKWRPSLCLRFLLEGKSAISVFAQDFGAIPTDLRAGGMHALVSLHANFDHFVFFVNTMKGFMAIFLQSLYVILALNKAQQ